MKTLTLTFTDHIPADATVRNLPHFDNTILGTTSYNIVIMWTPRYIQYRSFVPTYQRVVCSNSSYLDRQRNNRNIKGTSIKTNIKVPTVSVHSINEEHKVTKSKVRNTDKHKKKLFFIYHLILILQYLNNCQQDQS